MGISGFFTLLSKVASAIVIFLLGAFCALVVLVIYDYVYPPVQVTCWYCNEESSLKARGEETRNRWYCRRCENLNVRDENGDIVDEFPEMYSAKSNRPILPRRDLSQRFQSNVLCEDCIRKQQIIYNESRHYVKDESDPDYKLSLQVANWQREDLEEQYPLCEECSSKVEKALKEKNVPAIKRGVEDEEDDSWLDLMPEPEPIKLAQKPSFSFTVLSRVKGILWHLTHLSSLLMYSLALWRPSAAKGFLIRAAKSPFSLPFHSLKDMEWDYWQYWMVMSLASLYWMDWEPLTLRWYGHDRVQLHNHKQYKIAQRVMFALRVSFPLLVVSLTNDIEIKLLGGLCVTLSLSLLVYGMVKLTISFVERPARAITGRSMPKTTPLVREKSDLRRTKPAWQPMKLARQLREAVVRYVPAIEFYGLNGFGWKDDIFEPNPPPNDDFVKRNALVLMEEMKDVEYATDSEDNDSGSDDITSGLSFRPRSSSKLRKQRSFIRPSPLTTKREATTSQQLNGHDAPGVSVTRRRTSRRRLPLDYLDSDDEYEKEASDSDEDADRSGVPWRPHHQKSKKSTKTGLFERMQVRSSSAPCPPTQSNAYSSQRVF